jgi:hypothetical protein
MFVSASGGGASGGGASGGGGRGGGRSLRSDVDGLSRSREVI